MSRLSASVLGAALALWIGGTAVRAIDLDVTTLKIEQALALARGDVNARRAFHQPYLLDARSPTVTRLEAVTELRRMVLLAEQRILAGDSLFTRGTRQAIDALEPWKGKLAIVVSVSVDPRNVFVVAPPIDIVLTRSDIGDVLRERQTSRTVFGAGAPGSRLPVIGADAEASFTAKPLADGVATLVVTLGRREVARTRVDFRTLR